MWAQRNIDFYHLLEIAKRRGLLCFGLMLGLCFFIYSCGEKKSDSDYSFSSESTAYYIGTWRLVKITGNMSGSEKTGKELPFYEEYLISPDGTFTKIRIDQGITQRAEGSYLFSTNTNELTLNFSSTNDLIINCTRDSIEHLLFSTKKTCHNSAMACDQPGLFYEKITN